jgi:general secretion pathway protein M
MSHPTLVWQQALQARWATLGAREQRGLTLAAAALLALLVWSVALAPALRTLKSAQAQSAQLAQAAERMQTLQARARLLQAKPVAAPQEALKPLQTAVAALGKSASLQVSGEQATLTLKSVSAQSLGALLAPAPGSGSSPSEAHLQRDAASAEPLWSGSLVYRLPAQARGKS